MGADWMQSDPLLVQTFLSKRKMRRDLAKDIVEVWYEKVNSQQNTERVFESLSSSLQVCGISTHLLQPSAMVAKELCCLLAKQW
jgi:hypothetical protein